MIDLHAKRSAASLAVMLDWAAGQGVTPQQCLAGTATTPALVRRPAAEVSGEQELTAIANILAAVGDRPGLGLQAAAHYPITAFGVWGYAILTSATLGEAIDVAVRFVRLSYAFCVFETRRLGDELSIVIDARAVPAAVRRFVVERDAAAIPTLYREIFGESPPRPARVAFALPDPGPDLGIYEQFFGTAPVFDEAETSVTLCAAQLNVALPQASPHTAKLAEQQCRMLLERREARTGRAGVVRDLLLADPAHPPSLAHVAQRLATSSRTLRRQLEAEGTSFRRLLDEVRHHLGTELLRNGMTVEQVAGRLGYTDVSNFSHAFRRWRAESPRDYVARENTTSPLRGTATWHRR
ncbi:AraC family transcriptional regulator [Mycobacterium koreense]|uniref:AraC family transcriptional regulator n=2 Tax=Mycolicibacillus koreensis TaxID=1069220 RepID=A0A7I7SB16_9MYCO|nr:AraC family transcriptional regulator [Mycolicibacillus koreensis]MCV7249274.1 AraC family transcriptional regulator [Mycolicibacillus koreensis]ODR10215.1 transcriptional regulator [Mycolicibacillus koreensis]OSC35575.1 AraC family transcriptional regulator [Mycolicibacillus koreensis]BBY53185.1 transcriptional regulator [Mycolicibacillus koreensis]